MALEYSVCGMCWSQGKSCTQTMFYTSFMIWLRIKGFVYKLYKCLGLPHVIKTLCFRNICSRGHKVSKNFRLRCLSQTAILELHSFFASIHFSVQQCHLSVPVKARQELPCRIQVAHPPCGMSLGIKTSTDFPCHFQLFYRCGER